MISFFVPGDPKTAGSKKGFVIPNKSKPGHHRVILTDSSGQAGRDWRADVRAAAREVFPNGQELLDGPISLYIDFMTTRPKSHYRTGKHFPILREDAPPYPHRWKDLTKMLRALEDSLNGVIWTDDSRVCDQYISKRYGAHPGAYVRIEECHEKEEMDT